MDKQAWAAAFDAWLAAPKRWAGLEDWAREQQCLPVHRAWTHAFGVTVDGEVWILEEEVWPGAELSRLFPETPCRVTEVRYLNSVLIEGSKRYPWLAAIFPARPADAQDCSMCLEGLPPEPAICYCGGSGWVPADDVWVNSGRFTR